MQLHSIKNTAPESHEPRRKNALGKTSEIQIILAAERVLKQEGYHALSTRKVAKACGISVGNLTYHFPNKSLLMEALMQTVCSRYEQQRAAMHFNEAQNPQTYLRQSVSWMLNDAVDPETSALFVELWVLAKNHKFGSQIMERFYLTAAGWLAESLKFHFPNSKAKQRKQAAFFLLTLSEGCVAVFSRPCERTVDQNEIVEYAVGAVMAQLGNTR